MGRRAAAGKKERAAGRFERPMLAEKRHSALRLEHEKADIAERVAAKDACSCVGGGGPRETRSGANLIDFG